MIRWGEKFSYLKAQVNKEGLHFTRELVVRKEGKKEWRIDGKRETRKTPLPLVGYFPQDRVIKLTSERRDFLVDVISFLSPSYKKCSGSKKKSFIAAIPLREGAHRMF